MYYFEDNFTGIGPSAKMASFKISKLGKTKECLFDVVRNVLKNFHKISLMDNVHFCTKFLQLNKSRLKAYNILCNN